MCFCCEFDIVLFSPSIDGRMETINISNELLREENLVLQKEINSLEESRGALQASLSEQEMQIEKYWNTLQEKEALIAELNATVEVYNRSTTSDASREHTESLSSQVAFLNAALSQAVLETQSLR